MNNLDEARVARGNGLMAREEYWNLVRLSLASASNLSKLLEFSDSYIRISPSGAVLGYPLREDTYIEFVLDEEDTRSIGVSVVAEGPYEPVLKHALLEISKYCGLFVDIGANAGFYSIAVKATNEECTVLAFECNPDIRDLFLRNIQLNAISGIDVRTEALAESAGEADFYVPAFTGSGGGSLQDLHPEEGAANKFRVQLINLDSLKINNADVMKIDVEGAELGVIQGSLETIESSKPTIFIELLRKWMLPFGSKPSDVSEILLSKGYKVFEISNQGMSSVDTVYPDTKATNFVFVHPDRCSHLKALERLL